MEPATIWKALCAAASAIGAFIIAGGEIHITRKNVRIKLPSWRREN